MRIDGAESSTSLTKRTALATWVSAAVLGEEGAAHQADGGADDERDADLDQRADDGVEQAAPAPAAR